MLRRSLGETAKFDTHDVDRDQHEVLQPRIFLGLWLNIENCLVCPTWIHLVWGQKTPFVLSATSVHDRSYVYSSQVR